MEKKNVVIKVENEREYRALMKYYDTKGWTWIHGKEATIKSHAFCEGDGRDRKYIEFNDRFSSDASARTDEFVVPFAHLAAIEGIELEPDEVVIEINSIITAECTKDGVVFSDGHPGAKHAKIFKATIEQIEEIYTALKSFEK